MKLVRSLFLILLYSIFLSSDFWLEAEGEISLLHAYYTQIKAQRRRTAYALIHVGGGVERAMGEEETVTNWIIKTPDNFLVLVSVASGKYSTLVVTALRSRGAIYFHMIEIE